MLLPQTPRNVFSGAVRNLAMRAPWAAMIGVLAALAVEPVRAVAVEGSRFLDAEATYGLAARGLVLVAAAETVDSSRAGEAPASSGSAIWHGVETWVAESYERAPALMLGLAALLAVPPLAVIGYLLRRKEVALAGSDEVTTAETRAFIRPGTRAKLRRAGSETGPAWPSRAWIEIEGSAAERHGIGPSVVRIGRETDNDICLADETVHRYHAAVHRTEDADYVITDLSSADGNGVAINGRRVAAARLADGDTIELGRARLKFTARPV